MRHSAGSWSSATSRLTAPSPASPSNSDALFLAITRKSRRGPRTTPPHRTGTSARDRRDYKSQQVVRENRRIPPRLARLPEPSASRQSLEIEQNRSVGEGRAGRRGCGRRRLCGPPKCSRPPRPFRRGLLCARPGCRATPASRPLPAPPPPRTLPPRAADLWLGTRRSLLVPGRRSAAAYSRFPQAPGAHGFRSAGRGAGGNGGAEARSCHGDAR